MYQAKYITDKILEETVGEKPKRIFYKCVGRVVTIGSGSWYLKDMWMNNLCSYSLKWVVVFIWWYGWHSQLGILFYIQNATFKEYLWKRCCVLLRDTNTGAWPGSSGKSSSGESHENYLVTLQQVTVSAHPKQTSMLHRFLLRPQLQELHRLALPPPPHQLRTWAKLPLGSLISLIASMVRKALRIKQFAALLSPIWFLFTPRLCPSPWIFYWMQLQLI